jgi:acid phosphatase family membrane protein YuiD
MTDIIQSISALLNSGIFLSCFFAWFIAQFIKFVTAVIKEKRFAIDKMFALGGMPSSHSATIVALLLSTFFDQGITPLVIVILILALIVIRDSVGVRREVGKHAAILNKHILGKLKKGESEIERLEELVGHSLSEVIVGSVIGAVVAAGVYFL